MALAANNSLVKNVHLYQLIQLDFQLFTVNFFHVSKVFLHLTSIDTQFDIKQIEINIKFWNNNFQV